MAAKKEVGVPALRISSRPESWRRCGRVWTRTPQDVPVSEFSGAEVERLKAEEMLCVEEVIVTPPADGVSDEAQK